MDAWLFIAENMIAIWDHVTYLLTPTTATFTGDCSTVDWYALNGDGLPFLTVDANHDGVIDCDSDIELGA